MHFDVALSVGMNCQCRYNISRTLYLREHGNDNNFYIGESKKNVDDYGSFFFDWSVTPLQSAIKILRNQFEGCLQLENLKLHEFPDGSQTVIDIYTGCEYPHTFPKTDKGECTQEDINAVYDTVKQKYDYTIKKTIDVLNSNKTILFVLTGNHPPHQVQELCHVLGAFTDNFKVLFTPWRNKPGFYEESPLAGEPRILLKPITHAPYPGDFKSWDSAFFDINLKR